MAESTHLLGLAAKIAILFVEFAKQQQEAGKIVSRPRSKRMTLLDVLRARLDLIATKRRHSPRDGNSSRCTHTFTRARSAAGLLNRAPVLIASSNIARTVPILLLTRVGAYCCWERLERGFSETNEQRTHWPFLRDRRSDAYDGIEKRLIDD